MEVDDVLDASQGYLVWYSAEGITIESFTDLFQGFHYSKKQRQQHQSSSQ